MRHRWGDPVRPDINNTLRTCANCGLVKITRHEPDNRPPHWIEFRNGDQRVEMRGQPSKTPPCADYSPRLSSVPA